MNIHCEPSTEAVSPANIDDLEQNAAITHIRDLLSTHWREAQNSEDEEGKFGISFKVTFDRGASPTKIKVTCRISRTFSDEVESVIEDPQQPELPL